MKPSRGLSPSYVIFEFPGRICPGLIEAGESGHLVGQGHSHFPGESALASLKPPRGSGPPRPRTRDFPGESARASLKRPLAAGIPPPPRIFPGRICPGLIEARSSVRRRTRPTRPFPGRICPGLIEAAAHVGSPARAWVFPGRICPGLIEARSAAPRRSAGTRFPGRICPGLIEAVDIPKDNETQSTFPGRICPGLIEASAPRHVGSRCARTISRANLPGPH